MQEAIVVGQAHSRNGERDLITTGDALRARGIHIRESHLEPGRKAACKRIESAVKSGAKLIVVCGGDGTLTAAIRLLAHTKTVLGVIPAGTGNSFASSLGIHSLEDAFDAIAGGEERRVDVGIVNGKRFANFSTIGLATEIGDQTPRWLKDRLGPVAYGIAAIEPILRQRPFKAWVRWKKNRLTLRTRQIIVVSGRDYGHTPVTPETNLTNGMLTFFATEGTSALDSVRTYAAFLAHTQTSLPEVHYFQSECIKIKTSRTMRVAVDGKVVCKTPVTYRVDPKALRVMVPRRGALTETA
jgi:diacylglycerol kinase (ATP)